jgi:Putative transposase of IS4/5 family (DUF4096)
VGANRAAVPWRDLPSRYSLWQTCYDRFARWRRDGTWGSVANHAQTKSDAVGEVEWEVSVDAPLPKRTSTPRASNADQANPTRKGSEHPSDEALKRSWGGMSTKVYLSCGGRGWPLSVVVTPGQRLPESTQLGAVLDALRELRPEGAHRTRKHPERPIAYKGYSYPGCRRMWRKRGPPHMIP